MTEKIEQVLPPSEEDIANATAEAEKIFSFQTLVQAFSANIANRFHVQIEPGGTQAVIGIGSTGVIAHGIAGEAAVISPVSTVQAVYRVDIQFLKSLIETIGALLPPDPEGEKKDG